MKEADGQTEIAQVERQIQRCVCVSVHAGAKMEASGPDFGNECHV